MCFPTTIRLCKPIWKGYGNKPNENDELTDSDIEKLFGTETQIQVTNLLYTSFSHVLGMRGGVEHRTSNGVILNGVQMKTVTNICATKGRYKRKNSGLVSVLTSHTSQCTFSEHTRKHNHTHTHNISYNFTCAS